MTLYKYVPPYRRDGKLSILDNLRIRFTPFLEMNDPFESFFILEPLDRELEQAKADGFLAETIEARMMLEYLNRHLGLLSLSARKDELLLWAHYADNHRGMVIGFDSNHSFFQNEVHIRDRNYDVLINITSPGFGSLREVTYQNDRFPIKLGEDVLEAFFYKSQHWQYEEEYRVFRSLADANDASVTGIHLFDIPPEAITVVIAGARADESLRSAIKNKLSQPQYNHIKACNALLHHRSYALEFEDL